MAQTLAAPAATSASGAKASRSSVLGAGSLALAHARQRQLRVHPAAAAADPADPSRHHPGHGRGAGRHPAAGVVVPAAAVRPLGRPLGRRPLDGLDRRPAVRAAAPRRWAWCPASRGLGLAMLATGIGAALFHPVSAALVAQAAPPQQRGFWMSAYISAGNLGPGPRPAAGRPGAGRRRPAAAPGCWPSRRSSPRH